MPRIRLVLPLVAALALGGCDIQTIWGGESAAQEAERVAVAEARSVQVPIQSVHAIEIGRTRDGFLVTAHGTAPGLGYAQPTLRPRRGGAPGIDGYIEYDFVATEPPVGFDLPPGTAQTRRIRADLPVSANVLRGVAGVRVMGLQGGAQLDFVPVPPPGG